MANINRNRQILTAPVESPTDTFAFTPTIAETILTGITNVTIILDDANNELDIEVSFVGDAAKAAWIANPKGHIQIDDVLAPSPYFADLGAGQPIETSVLAGSEGHTQSRFINFRANRSIQIHS